MFDFWAARRARKQATQKIYDAMVRQARMPVFYIDLSVPDTPDGRLDLILLHAFLVHNRIKEEQGAAQFSQYLFDHMFREFDKALREMGVGDLSVPKQMKYMMKSYNGRLHRYAACLENPDQDNFKDALRENMFRKSDDIPDAHLTVLENYISGNISALATQDWSAINNGEITFRELSL